MLGGMLAGAEECEGEWGYRSHASTGFEWSYYQEHKEEYKKSFKFYGMASKTAQKKYDGGMSNYKAEEGKCVQVPYKGPVSDIVREIKGGLSSCCSYVGAARIKDLPKCALFVRTTQQENIIFNTQKG